MNHSQAVVAKFEAKLKRRDADIREKTHELRKLRAEAANAKLQVRDVSKSGFYDSLIRVNRQTYGLVGGSIS